MEINSEAKVYRVRLYKDNSIKISELDGDVYEFPAGKPTILMVG